MLNLFKWDEKMSVDGGDIDEQHKTMIISANLLFDSLSKGKSQEVVEGGMKCLRNYIMDHFGYEERYMKEHSYPALEEHLKFHEAFLFEYDLFLKRFKMGEKGGRLATDIHGFISDWMIKHIVKENTDYHEFWNKGEKKESL